MLVRTHVAFALLTALILSIVFPFENLPLFFALVIIGATLPDVDHERSTINRILPLTRWVPHVFRHRGFFHSIFPIGLLYGGFYYGGYPTAGLYLGIGYLSHLVSDGLTKLGVNFLHPVWNVRARGIIEVGTFEETLFFLGLVVMTVLVLLYR